MIGDCMLLEYEGLVKEEKITKPELATDLPVVVKGSEKLIPRPAVKGEKISNVHGIVSVAVNANLATGDTGFPIIVYKSPELEVEGDSDEEKYHNTK